MATDYDAPRVVESDADESLDALAGRRDDAATAVLDDDAHSHFGHGTMVAGMVHLAAPVPVH